MKLDSQILPEKIVTKAPPRLAKKAKKVESSDLTSFTKVVEKAEISKAETVINSSLSEVETTTLPSVPSEPT